MIINRINFHIDRTLKHFPQPLRLEREVQYTPAYYNKSEQFDGLFVYTEKGRGCFRKNKRQWDLLPGTAYVCCGYEPGVSYFYPPDATEPWTFWWLAFKGDNAESMLKELINIYGNIYKLSSLHPVLTRLTGMLEQENPDKFISAHMGSTMVFDIINMLAEVYGQTTQKNGTSQLAAKAQRLILKHLDDNISCEKIADLLGISKEYFSRQFKHETGIQPGAFIVKCKIQKACGLLKETNLSCKEIAFAAGYENTSNFIRAFKKYQHMTPRQFRQTGALPKF